MDDPWGLDEPPAPHPGPDGPLPPRLARLAALTGPVPLVDQEALAGARPEELPEVAALWADRWRPLAADGLMFLLPAVWPREHRCWLPDRRPHTAVSFTTEQAWVHPWVERDVPGWDFEGEEAASAGLPAPPKGRIWMLRSPWPVVDVAVVLKLVLRRAEQLGGFITVQSVTQAATEMLIWDESELRSWWTGESAEAFTGWEQLGRVGEAVAELVIRALGPTEIQRLQAAGISEEQAIRWFDSIGHIGRPGVDRILLWRHTGIGAEPPASLYRFDDWPDEQILAWRAARMSVEDMIELIEFPLERVLPWLHRDRSIQEIARLLNADPQLTPQEAKAFEDVGLEHAERWIECGFSAQEAAAFAAADIHPQEARVWRAQGFGPADVGPGERLPPGYRIGGWVMGPGTDFRDITHQVADPPGTRGRAVERSGGPLGWGTHDRPTPE